MSINFRIMFVLAFIICLTTTVPLYLVSLKRYHFSKMTAGVLALMGTFLLATGAFAFLMYSEIIDMNPLAYFIVLGPLGIVSIGMLLLLGKLTKK